MGADLYIESVFKPSFDTWSPKFEEAVVNRDRATTTEEKGKWQKKVTQYYEKAYSKGYFRDSYNITNVLNTFGLSWWQDVIPLTDDEGYLQPQEVNTLLDMILSRNQKLPTMEELREGRAKMATKNALVGWHGYYREKGKKLIAFLKLAKKLNSPIKASL